MCVKTASWAFARAGCTPISLAMKRMFLAFAALTAAVVLSPAADAQETDVPVPFAPLAAAEADLDALKWIARPIVVFADTPADPRFVEQMRLLQARPEALAERDVVVIIDTDPSARSELRTKLRPRGFQMTLIGKDGGIKLRKPAPWDVREITRAIDKMPLRQDEIRRGRADS